MSDYNAANYRKQGGAETVIGSNGTISVKSGGTLNVEAGGALQLSGTAMTPTANELNILTGSGVTAAEMAKLSAAGYAADGLDQMRVARFTFDATAIPANRTVGAHGTGVTLPINAVVYGGFYDVNTAFTSAANTATVAISVEAANDIVTATAVSNAIFGTIGRKAIAPKAATPETTSVKATAAREITCTVDVENLTNGKLTGFLLYTVSAVSA